MEKEQEKINAAEQIMLTAHENEEREIDLIELFYLLWEHALQIVGCILTGCVLAFVGTYFLITPQYQATAKMYVVSASNNSIVNLSDLQLGSQLTADYQELLLSRTLLRDVIDTLELDVLSDLKSVVDTIKEEIGLENLFDEQETEQKNDWEELMENISIENPIDTRILSITVTYPDPQLAAQIVNEIAYQAVEYLPDIMESPAPNIYEEATVPTQKSSPSYKINTVVGGFLFALIYCSILMGKYFIKDTFETPEDVTRFFGIQPLAVVPERNMGLNKSKHGNRSLQKKVTAGSV